MSPRRRCTAAEKAAAVRAVLDLDQTNAEVAGELGLRPGTLAAWVRVERTRRRGEEWAHQVRPHFDFLTDHGFALTDVDADDWWAIRVVYRSDRSAVRVVMSHEFNRVELELMRLVDGKLPEHPIFLMDSVPLNDFLADDLIRMHVGEETWRTVVHEVSAQTVQAQLAFWAAALREHGQDFLAGDLTVLDELERLNRAHARAHPRQVGVYLPESASVEEEADAIARIRAITPDEIGICVGRYRQGGSTKR